MLIAQTDARKISISPEKRSDLSSCNATEGEEMLTALYNCWPVLQPMQIYHEAGDEFIQTRSTDKRRPGKQDRLLKAADQIIDLTRERKYPMQDMPLILAHMMKVKIFQARGEYKRGITEIEKVNAIMKTSQITDPNFNRN